MESIVKVQFRKDKGGVFAVFPYIIETSTNVMCYAHIGQHSGCIWCINQFSKAAKFNEYKDLLNELIAIGYNVEVINKRSHKEYLKYLRAYYSTL